MDVDYFKQANDTCGHTTGDSVLRMVTPTRRYALVDTRASICMERDWRLRYPLAAPCSNQGIHPSISSTGRTS